MSNHHTTRSTLKTWKDTGASFLTVVSLLMLTACGGDSEATEADLPDGVRNEVTLGVTDIDNAWETFVDIADRDYGIDVELVSFSDIILPNEALANEEIDANAFQHVLYLAEFSHANQLDLETVGVTGATTVGLYSQDAQDLEDIPNGGKVMIANDPTNQGRALQFLDRLGLITLNEDVGHVPSLDDVEKNPQSYEFIEITGAQIPLSLPDADAAVIYQFAADRAGIDRDLAIADDSELIHEPEFLPYQSVFAARAEDVADPTWAIFEKIYHSDEMIDVFEVEYQGARVHSQSSLEEIQELQHEIQDSLEESQ